MADAATGGAKQAIASEPGGLRAVFHQHRRGVGYFAMQTVAVGFSILVAFGVGIFVGTTYMNAPVVQRIAGSKTARPAPEIAKAEPKIAKRQPVDVVGLEPEPEIVIPAAKPKKLLEKTASVPETSIDLSFWKVTLPVNDEGIVSGVGDATEETELKGFAMPPYFEVASNSISFMAPTIGARTGGSNYPRSELREMDGQGDEYEWRIADGGRLEATLTVDELPETSDNKPGRIIIGQIHGPDDELCRLYFDDGKLYFIDDKSGDKLKETRFDLVDKSGKATDIALGDVFAYSIDVDDKKLIVKVTHGGTEYSATDVISRFWTDKDLYFKAGAYVQVGKPGSQAGSVGSGQGKITVSKLSRPTHDIFRAPKARKSRKDDLKKG